MKHKCPKCGNGIQGYIELWKDHSIVFLVNEEGNIDTEGFKSVGDPYGVRAWCLCGHQWRVRGVTQITELMKKYGTCGKHD